MKQSFSIRGFCGFVFKSVTLVLLAAASQQAAAQSFAIGAGGFLVNDTGTAADVRGFGTYGGHLFAEVDLEKNVAFQIRASRFGLAGTAENTPNLRADAVMVSVSYLFTDEWFKAGFFAGAGAYRLQPNDLEPGQVPVDGKETAFGWHGGILTVFAISPRFDARVEASGHLIRTDVGHTTILLGGSIAYHF
ncbi:MAG: outer membrane beta-barrel protein [Thermoanaerobaculia bacterium]